MLTQLGLSNSVTSWVLLVLALAFAVAFFLTAQSWRQARLSPYYFQRRQAIQQMQSYSLASIALLMATVTVMAYAWSPAVSNTPLTAVITDAKPLEASVANAAPPAAARQIETPAAATAPNQRAITRQLRPELPAEFSQLTPTNDLRSDTNISGLLFSTDINDNYEPVGVRSTFAEGVFTLYATFDYANMVDGMVWSWVWRLDGEVIGGGEQVWQYGDEGPGWVYLQPEEGFSAGEYTVELWVNGELQSSAQAAVSASIAR